MSIVGVNVHCKICGGSKAPIGRSAPLQSYMCNLERCEGYMDDPQPGWLFHGEYWAESFSDIPEPQPSECYRDNQQ